MIHKRTMAETTFWGGVDTTREKEKFEFTIGPEFPGERQGD